MSIKRIVIILTILFCGCQQRDTFKVGVELPLSGDAAQYGAAMKNGIDLAYSESPIKSDIQLLYEDDRGDPKTSTSIVTKFVSNNKVDVIIGGAMSSIAASIIPITSKHKTVVISPYATAAELFREGKYFYSLLPSDDAEGEYMVNYMASVGIDSIGVLYINTDYGTGIAAAFTKGCEKQIGTSNNAYEHFNFFIECTGILPYRVFSRSSTRFLCLNRLLRGG
ncbi:hypothetical protein FACS189443_2310 [Planctomycetales bacterium]|nr:hypothetical protein FACS189443_2310 [Planctomycetales bacterium]